MILHLSSQAEFEPTVYLAAAWFPPSSKPVNPWPWNVVVVVVAAAAAVVVVVVVVVVVAVVVIVVVVVVTHTWQVAACVLLGREPYSVDL